MDRSIGDVWKALTTLHHISPHLTRFHGNIYRTFSVDWMGCVWFLPRLTKLFHCTNSVPGAMYAESLSGKRMQRLTPAEQQVVKVDFLAPSLVVWVKGSFLNHSKQRNIGMGVVPCCAMCFFPRMDPQNVFPSISWGSYETSKSWRHPVTSCDVWCGRSLKIRGKPLYHLWAYGETYQKWRLI